ncbi:MAG: NAD-dependent epimerase/dehydratase family protein [Anaerolineae bacterium]|nr:NAD-dependent epimerase/dehydratase family protein [Anaerolineae bacterium]
MTRVLITGGTGFLGSALARVLAARGDRVRVLARPSSDLSRLHGVDVEVVRGDVLEPSSLRGAMQGIEVVYHLAGMLGGMPVPDPAYRALHVEGTRHVVQAADAAGARRFLHVSSPGVLGPIEGPPADETAPYAPTNVYERTKAEGERLALDLGARASLSLSVARPEFVYGPGDTHVLGLYRTIARGMFFYIGSGESMLHPTYVDDAVRGMALCAEGGRAGRVYHIAGPQPVTIRTLATTIAAALGVAPPRLRVPLWLATTGALVLEAAGRVGGFRPPLSRSAVAFFTETRAFSTERARAELGYVPQVSLPEGVRRTVAWYREQGLL